MAKDKPYELLQVIIDLIITPLQNFEQVASELDVMHTYTLNNFFSLIDSLFESPDPAIQGGGAAALLQNIQNYEDSEQNETGYGSNGETSLLISDASWYCKKAASNLGYLIDNFPSFGILQMIEDGILPPLALTNTPFVEVQTSELEITRYLNTPDRTYQVSLDQLSYLDEMGYNRRKWGYKMANLYKEPRLPTPPNNLPISFITLPSVTLTPPQEQKVNDIMNILAAGNMTNIPRQYIEVLISEGFSEADILAAVQGWQAAGKMPAQIADLLYLAAFHILLGPYYRSNMLPNGMNAQQYQEFVSTLRSGLAGAGYCAGAGVGGSTVTGYKYTTGRPFDGDPNMLSDYDLALADPGLLRKAEAMGIKLRDGNTHTEPLKRDQLDKLGLTGLVDKLQALSGREVHFMIYNSLVATSARAPYIYFFGNSCTGS